MMLYRPKALQSIVGFDEKFFLDFEDSDLSPKLKTEGDIYLVPKMKLHLFGGNTSNKDLRHMISFIKSAYFF